MSGDKQEETTNKKTIHPETGLSRESATAEYNRLLEYYDIIEDEITGEDDEGRDLRMLMRRARRRFVDLIQDGHVVIEYGIECSIHHKMYKDGASSLVYGEMTARIKKLADTGKERDNYNRLFATMAALAKVTQSVIEAKSGKDLRAIETISMVFTVA